MNFAIVLILALMFATALVLVLGIVQMAKGGRGDAVEQGERSNRLMVWRIGLQAATLILAVIVMLVVGR